MKKRSKQKWNQYATSLSTAACNVTVFACILALTACVLPKRSVEKYDGPRIFSIGRGATLSFEKGKTLEIPIEGMELANSLSHRIDVSLSATRPITSNDYTLSSVGDSRDNLDLIRLTLSTNYLEKVETRDTLDLAVHIYEVDPVRLALTETSVVLSNRQTLSREELSRLIGRVNFAVSKIMETKGLNTNTAFACTQIQTQLNNCSDSLHKLASEQKASATAQRALKEREALLGAKIDESKKKSEQSAMLLTVLQDNETALRLQVEELLAVPPGTTNALSLSSLTNLLTGLKTNLHSLGKTEAARIFLLSPRSIQEGVNSSSYKQVTNLVVKYISARTNLDQATSELAILTNAVKKAEEEFSESRAAHNSLEEKIITLEGDYQKAMDKSLEAITSSLYQLEASTGNGKMQRRKVSTASRTFTFHSIEELRRDYLSKRILPNDIMAFPEPEEEADKLFGKNIAKHYYVVRLSIRNPDTKEDKLVSTGMIRARGRALVEAATSPSLANGDNDGNQTRVRFTVPVEVAPHSAQQVYAVLTDTSVNQTRAVTFRALEMAGSIASAYALSFNVGTATKDAIQLATGIGVPAFSKFWTDKLPGYERNVVNFAMEDLVKVPKGGVASHKFLFFPKDKIEAIIIDQYSYGAFQPSLKQKMLGRAGGDGAKKVTQPDAFVAYLTFDNLDVPYENVFQVEDATAKQRALRVLSELREEVDFRDNLDANVTVNPNSSDLFARHGITVDSLTNLSGSSSFTSACNGASTNLTALAATLTMRWPDATNFLPKVDSLLNVSRELRPESLKQCVLTTNRPLYRNAKAELQEYVNMMLSGRASDQFEKRLLELSAISREAKIESNFYHLCAKLIGNKELKEALFRLKALPANMNDQQVGEVIKLLTQLRDDLKALDVARKDYESRLMPTVKL